jgi:hypothetical protein
MDGSPFENSRLWLKENVFFIQLDDRAVLLDTNRRSHFTPNESAAFLLRLLVNDGGVHFNDLVHAIMEHYAMGEDQARSELLSALESFESLQVLGWQEVKEYTAVPLLALEAEEFAKRGEKPPPPALESWAEARLVQGGTLLSMGRVPFVKSVYTG